MDYQLENKNLSLNEKNKQFFSDIEIKCPENPEQIEDTFKMYSQFMQEKDGLLKIINELIDYGKSKFQNPTVTSQPIKDILSAIDYKNRVIMIVRLN
jgi:hypothetical protein